MDIAKTGNTIAVIGGLILIYLAIAIMLDTFSSNKADFSTTYFSKAHAQLNFFQDSGLQQNYKDSGNSFWSSPVYHDPSFGTMKVTHGSELAPASITIGTANSVIISNISRDSH